MDNIEKTVKDIVNTGLGAINALKANFEESKQKAVDFLNSKQDEFKKFFDELELKGQTDQSEMSVEVREKVKEIFKTIYEYQNKLNEMAEENFAKLRLELSKHNITLPELDELKSNIQKSIDEGKGKIEGVVDNIKQKTDELKGSTSKPAG